MTMVEHSSTARRLNGVDVFIFALVVVMIPMAYGAYALFRNPPATLSGVEPRQVTAGPNLRVHISGANLRPFMRVSFNTTQGRTFMIGSTTTADVDLPDLDPGVYDVVLFDYAQEIARLPKAFTVLPRTPAPTVTVAVAGDFIGLTDAQLATVTRGSTYAQQGRVGATVLAIGERHPSTVRVRTGGTNVTVDLPAVHDLAAVLKVECYLEGNSDGSLRCVFYGPVQPAAVAPDSVLQLPVPGGLLNFQVNEVHSAAAPAFVRVRVRIAPGADVAARVRPGDRDSATTEYEGAWIGRVESVSGGEVILRLPAQRASAGWSYQNQPLKVGAPLHFETERAAITGTIADVVGGGPQVE